jgi:hypothetical protein
MKPYYTKMVTLLAAAMTVVTLGACSKTDNSSANNPAAVTPGTCTMSWDGTLRDQYGRSCNATNLAYGCSTYTGYAGQSPYCGGSQYTLPTTGYYYGSGGSSYAIGGGTDGCMQWSYYYGQTYVPVNLGGGQLMCVSWAYLSGYLSSYPSYYQNYNNWYQMPPSVYMGNPYSYGYGGGYYGYNYCQSNLNFGFSTGGFGAGVNLCF